MLAETTAVPAADTSAPSASTAAGLRVLRPGRLAYADGLALQEDLVTARRRGEVPDTLVLLEHDAVVTLGRGADPAHVLADGTRLASRGIARFETGRGGDVTLHSPGQVVGYPVLALEGERRDTHRYLRDLEEVMIRVAADFGVKASRLEGLTGIWVGREKLGAIGVRLNSGWITSHGFAFNVSNDLSLFDVIVPCGLQGRGVTSLQRELGHLGQTAQQGARGLPASRTAPGDPERTGLRAGPSYLGQVKRSLGGRSGQPDGQGPHGSLIPPVHPSRPLPRVSIEEVMDRFEQRFSEVFAP